jgi:adenine-specific DNA-methyltransferase
MPSGKSVEIQKAKGRPMLTWVGKQPLKRVIAYPAQLIETFGDPSITTPTRRGKAVGAQNSASETWSDWPSAFPHSGLLFHGDNKDVLAYLLANGFRGKVKLIYIDPPFDSGADYIKKINLRSPSQKSKLLGEEYGLGEQIQYTDIWTNDNYLQFMYERFLLLKELLDEDGSLYLHCDNRRNYYLRTILDEVFSPSGFQSEIVWKRTSAHSDSSRFGQIHDTIYLYTKTDISIWNEQIIKYDDWYIERYYRYTDEKGRRFKSGDLSAYGLKGGGYSYEWKGISGVWRCPPATMKRLDDEGRLYYTENGIPRLIQYLDEMEGLSIQSLWDDIQPLVSWSSENENYPTQKPEELVQRIINSSSNFGDLILDCFVGSGTTAAVAQKHGRRWIACDINKGAIQTTTKRLQTIIEDQRSQPPVLPTSEEEGAPTPCQHSFSVFRVNDYDLQIQYNEALNLACEHLGVTRSKTDRYFDGVLGKNLVKIIPFNHPLTPLDLEEIKQELKNRPDEIRSITVVSLGKEMAVDAWLEEWNRFRKQRDIPNKIDLIELRTDPKAGGFFAHQPDQAEIEVKRDKDTIHIEIKTFISPTIVERLRQQAGVLTPQIDDWRAMVDSVMIDTDYDDKVFNIVYADIPEKKTDLVAGFYDIDFPKGKKKTTVAIKITDMLGEELLSIHQI